MKHGIRRELIPLVKIRNIGRVRARRLFNSGITSPEKILAAGEEKIIPILGQGITNTIFRDLKSTEPISPRKGAPPVQPTLFQFGDDNKDK